MHEKTSVDDEVPKTSLVFQKQVMLKISIILVVEVTLIARACVLFPGFL
jgi:hypothetical protein